MCLFTYLLLPIYTQCQGFWVLSEFVNIYQLTYLLIGHAWRNTHRQAALQEGPACDYKMPPDTQSTPLHSYLILYIMISLFFLIYFYSFSLFIYLYRVILVKAQDASVTVMVGKLDKQTCKSEFESYWVPHSLGLVPHLSKNLVNYDYREHR